MPPRKTTTENTISSSFYTEEYSPLHTNNNNRLRKSIDGIHKSK